MSKFARAIAIVLTFTGPAWAQTWSEYRPAGAGYRIEMPDTPQVSSNEVTTKIGRIQITMAMIDKNPIAFIVGHNDYPKDYVAGTTADKILDGVRDGQVGKDKLIGEERLKMDTYPARRISILKGKEITVSHIVLVGTRLYQASYIGPLGTEKGADAQRFMNSFAVVAR